MAKQESTGRHGWKKGILKKGHNTSKGSEKCLENSKHFEGL